MQVPCVIADRVLTVDQQTTSSKSCWKFEIKGCHTHRYPLTQAISITQHPASIHAIQRSQLIQITNDLELQPFQHYHAFVDLVIRWGNYALIPSRSRATDRLVEPKWRLAVLVVLLLLLPVPTQQQRASSSTASWWSATSSIPTLGVWRTTSTSCRSAWSQLGTRCGCAAVGGWWWRLLQALGLIDLASTAFPSCCFGCCQHSYTHKPLQPQVVVMTHAYGDCTGVRYLTNGLKVSRWKGRGDCSRIILPALSPPLLAPLTQ